MDRDNDIDTNEFVLSLVEFCILMQGDGGILGKAPRYILEKFDSVDGTGAQLDGPNTQIFRQWCSDWSRGAKMMSTIQRSAWNAALEVAINIARSHPEQSVGDDIASVLEAHIRKEMTPG